MTGLTLTANDNGKSFEVKPGGKVVIRLEENPTTGFTWAIDRLDEQFLALQTSEYVSSENGLAGKGGERTFTFGAKKPGLVSLELKHWREWVGDKSIVGRYSVTFKINN